MFILKKERQSQCSSKGERKAVKFQCSAVLGSLHKVFGKKKIGCFLGSNLVLYIFALKRTPCLSWLIRADFAVPHHWAQLERWLQGKRGKQHHLLGMAHWGHVGREGENWRKVVRCGTIQRCAEPLCACKRHIQAIRGKSGKMNRMKPGLLNSPSTAFMQKRNAGGRSCQFFLSITGRQNRVRASGNKGRTRNERSVRHKELFLHLLILQSKFIYSQAFTWDNAQSYNNVLRISSPDAKA